ncbi:flippase [Thermodesulfobacteriota bacterium]
MNLFRILRNASFGLIGTFTGIPFQVIAFILIARNLGSSQFGEYSFAIEYSLIFSLMADGGLSILSTRELSRHHDSANVYFVNILLLKVLITAVFYIIMISVAYLFHLDTLTLYAVYILGAGNFLCRFSIFIAGVFRAYERMEFEGLLSFVQAVAFLASIMLVVFVFHQGADFSLLVWCLFVSYLLPVGIGFYIIKHYLIDLAWKWRIDLVKYFIKEAAPIAIALVLIGTYSRINILVLKALSTSSELGLFNVAFRVAFQLCIIPTMLCGAWLPVLSCTYCTEPEQFYWNISQLNRILLLTSIPLTVIVFILASPITLFLYGEAYAPSASSLQVLMGYTFCTFVSFGSKTVLESCGRQSWWTIALIVGLIVSIGLNLYLVPLRGSVGAAIATTGACLFTTAVSLFSMFYFTNWRPQLLVLTRISVSCIVMSFCIYLLKPVSWVLAGVCGGIIYGFTLIFLREVDFNEVKLFCRHFFRLTAPEDI